MRKTFLFLICFLFTLACLAEDSNCDNVMVFDAKLLGYPPIARAAHMQGKLRFVVVVHPDGHSEVSFLDGPTLGMYQIFLVSGREFLEARRYGWIVGGVQPQCRYTAEIEYRMLSEEVDAPNNFMRVTQLDLSHTLIEVKATKLVVMH